MRTKTLLLAAAALAAGISYSEAQNVYSQNIVGYVNYISKTNSPDFEMINNPLDNGSNTVASLFAAPPGGTQLQVWNGGSFTTYTYTKLGGWGANGSVVINPGIGFFISVGGTGVYTNTFVGNVSPNTGLSKTNVIGTGFQALSSMIPYSDSVSNTTTINLAVPGGTQVQTWNVGSQNFSTYTYVGLSKKWTPTDLTVGVGQGMFIENNSGAPINWVQKGP